MTDGAYEVVYALLRRELMSGAIASGARLREVEVAERLHVSRTPVREAFRRLESDGFVERTPSVGLVVTAAGPDDIGDLGLLRVEVDGLAARLACARSTGDDWAQAYVLVSQMRTAADDEELAHTHRLLHREIYSQAFSPRLAAFFNGTLLPYIEDVVNVGPGRRSDPDGAFRQHLELVSILSAGDAEAAEQAAREHAESGVRYARTAVELAAAVVAS